MRANPKYAMAAPARDAAAMKSFERIDGEFLAIARNHGAEEFQFPSLIGKALLEQAEYPKAFPHLLMMACACGDPAHEPPFAPGNLAPQDWYLSPAVCYHAYAHFQEQTLGESKVVTARGRCYRREDHFQAGRRQLEFEMREIILIGDPGWLEEKASRIRDEVDRIARNLPTRWETAEDPFFLPTARGKALMQRLMETKKELICDRGGKLAIGSINRHGTFFGERFAIGLSDGGPAHTACIAFGLDRWAGVLGSQDL